jgi:transcriptional regulator with XRE-family HTH domain
MSDLAHRLGLDLRRARLAQSKVQARVGARYGIAQSTWSRLELGVGGSISLDVWEAAANALGLVLAADLVGPAPSDPLDGIRRLVLGLAEQGGWSSHTTDDGQVRLSRAARREAAVVGLWDVASDVVAGVDDLTRAIGLEAHRRPKDWRTGGVLVVKASGPNRRRLSEASDLLDEVFPDSGTRWMTALRTPTSRMPDHISFCWASGDATRLTPARLPLIRPRR